MSAENKVIARRVREEIWNNGLFSMVDQLFDAHCTYHLGDSLTTEHEIGPQGFKDIVAMYRAAFPDARMTINDLLAEGDKVMVRWTAHGTHLGQLLNFVPTRKVVTVSGIDVYRIFNGKIEETWVSWDALGFLQQLGVIPAIERTRFQVAS
ncbi:MAG: ester cyclase [Terriglobia bacterium]